MKKILSIALIATLCLGLVSCLGKSTFKGNEGVSKGQIDSVSKAIGVFLGIQVLAQQQYGELNYDLMFNTMKKAMADTAFVASLDMNELNQTIQNFMMQRQQMVTAKALQDGIDFLEKNKTAEGVITLESGLQYKILEEGSGIKPQAIDTVEVHYTGRLVDGTKFESSLDSGIPYVTPLNGVVAGWTEGFQHFSEGTKAVLYIPSELAYGPQGDTQVLIFEVELLKVRPAIPAK